MKEMTQTYRKFLMLGTLWAASGMAAMACSKSDSVNPQDSGTHDGGVPITACGALSAEQAAQFAARQLEDFGTVGLGALAGLENSRVAARVISFGDLNILDPFVADTQSNLHDSLTKLRDEQLIASNVETTTESSVTFLLRPETVCSSNAAPVPALGTGGTSASSTSSALDANCVTDNTEHPKRIRISRIACDQGDNVAIELLVGPQSEHVVTVAMYADHADLDADVGAILRQSYAVSYSSAAPLNGTTVQTRTETPLVSSASGELTGTLTVLGPQRARGFVSIARAIDVTFTDDQTTHIQLGAAPNAVSVEADGDAKTIQVAVNAGALDWRTKFTYFIQDFFGLQTTVDADTAAPVNLNVTQARATLAFDGTADSITATNLDLGSAGFTAMQGNDTLLALTTTDAQGRVASATLLGGPANDLGLSLPSGLVFRIQYGLLPVLPLLQSPANFTAADALAVSAPEGSVVTLLNDPATNAISVLQDPTGQLLRVDAGALGIASTLWPSDSVTVPANQCLTRTITSVAGRHDLLDDFTVGACVQQ